ncbi:acyl-CoA thioester hydrolase [Oceanobacillus limi]|uniref:Acyl-CoA thioester hydrolase n=1 Tax=Oceanobacillus limi TaxID=930131 RepID=A0A1I0A953_9BACI|nr:thioesterase family protein [Oceanobacillus limi]SES89772.1 acyl-CoA thioester hydrolase [Oceanobacillus limi]
MEETWYQENLRVQYKDTDQMGIVHHTNYVSWFEIGRTEWMRYYGLSYHKMEEQGLLLPVMDVNVEYKKPARFDDCVAIFTNVATYSPVRLEFVYEARKISEQAYQSGSGIVLENIEHIGELLAKGSTKHMWVNQKWKPTRIDKTSPKVYQTLKQR